MDHVSVHLDFLQVWASAGCHWLDGPLEVLSTPEGSYPMSSGICPLGQNLQSYNFTIWQSCRLRKLGLSMACQAVPSRLRASCLHPRSCASCSCYSAWSPTTVPVPVPEPVTAPVPRPVAVPVHVRVPRKLPPASPRVFSSRQSPYTLSHTPPPPPHRPLLTMPLPFVSLTALLPTLA